jgi:hypothetical protein
MKKLRRWLKLAGFGLLAWALATELSKDPDKREWNGELAGIFPYDFRVPSVEKVRRTFWDTDSDRLLKPKVFGVGWSVNFGALARFFGVLDSGRSK